MGSFSGLGIGLSFLFGCILMGLVAELYYLLWCKKKKTTSSNNYSRDIKESPFFFCCFKKPVSCDNIQQLTTSSARRNNPQEDVIRDLEMGSSVGKNSCFNSSYNSKGSYDHELEGGGVEAELMRMHNLCGPPRFLFTIKEESKEDLESEKSRNCSRKSSRTKSLGDLVFTVDNNNSTPFLTPMSSPTVKTSHSSSLDSYNNHGFNPLFESMSEAEVNRLRSSPPPKFKFLKDAEDKLIKRLLVEEVERKRRCLKNDEDRKIPDMDANNNNQEAVKVDSLVKLSNESLQVRDHQLRHNNKPTSQVIPLASSPTSKPVMVMDKKSLG